MKTTALMIALAAAAQMATADVQSQIVEMPPNQGPRLRLGPKPPVERFPPQPYIPPPTPEEKEEARLEREALAAVQVRRAAAVAAILDRAAISTNGLTRLQVAEARAAALEAAAATTADYQQRHITAALHGECAIAGESVHSVRDIGDGDIRNRAARGRDRRPRHDGRKKRNDYCQTQRKGRFADFHYVSLPATSGVSIGSVFQHTASGVVFSTCFSVNDLNTYIL